MRLGWFKNLKPTIQTLVLSGVIFLSLTFYVSLSKYIKSAAASLILPPLSFCEGLSVSAKQFLKFQDLVEENRRLNVKLDLLTVQLRQLEEAQLENGRLRALLSLPQQERYQAQAALLIGKDSSNWTQIAIINKGTSSGIKEGMPAVLGANLAGRVIETQPFTSKVALIVDCNSKIPAKILRSREEGLVFGTVQGTRAICKMKYLQGAVEIGDEIISSGLGDIYPKGLLIGKVASVKENEEKLYKVAEITPAVDFSSLEELMIITSQ